MVSEARADTEVELARGRRVRPLHGYYRQPDGWITASIVTELEELAYRRGGWEPLPQYGRFDLSSIYTANHPLEALFIKGGAKELPVDQVIKMAFHINVPVIPGCRQVITQFHKMHGPECWVGQQVVVFPQLEGQNPPTFPCGSCTRVSPTKEAHDQHEQVAHKEERNSIRTGTVLADAIVQGLKGQSLQAPAAPAPARATLPYICGGCGEGFRRIADLKKHAQAERRGGGNVSEAS